LRSSLGCSPARISFGLLIQRSPPRLLNAAAWTGLGSAPESRSRGAPPHLSRSFSTRLVVHNKLRSVCFCSTPRIRLSDRLRCKAHVGDISFAHAVQHEHARLPINLMGEPSDSSAWRLMSSAKKSEHSVEDMPINSLISLGTRAVAEVSRPNRSSATRSIDNSLGGSFLHW
jgi:hypothetical protein